MSLEALIHRSEEIVVRAANDPPSATDLARTMERRHSMRAIDAVLYRRQLDSKRKYEDSTSLRSLQDATKPVAVDLDIVKREADPVLVIDAARRRYGIDASRYSVGMSGAGEPRIFHEGRQYNVGDFLTKHLQRSWPEAREVLQSCYYAGLSDRGPAPDRVLWRQFTAWRSKRITASASTRGELAADFRAQVLEGRRTYKAAKEASRALRPRARGMAIARARAERILLERAIAAKRADAYASVRTPPRQKHYREFLNELAGRGDVLALDELRRMAILAPGNDTQVTGVRSRAAFALPRYRVDALGGVVYSDRSGALVRDGAHGVAVLQATESAYDAAIRVAAARYGREVELRGDHEFKRRMVDAARRSGLALAIHDAELPGRPQIVVLAPARDVGLGPER